MVSIKTLVTRHTRVIHIIFKPNFIGDDFILGVESIGLD